MSPVVPAVPDADKFPGWPLVAGGNDEAGADPAGGDGGDGGGDPDAGGGEPAGGDGEDDPVDLDAVAAEFDRQALASVADEGDGDPDAGEGEGSGKGKGAARADASDSALRDFVNKHYNGDEAAFLHSIGESHREAKRLAALVEEMQGRPSKPPAPRDLAAEFKAAREADSEVQALDHDIKQIDRTVDAIQQRQIQLSALAVKVNEEITALEAEIPYIEDSKDQAKKQARLSRLNTTYASYQSEFQTNDARLEQQGRSKSQALRELKRAEEAVRDRLKHEEESQREVTVSAERTRKHFETAFQILIKPYNLDPKSGVYKFAHASVRTILADHLESLGEEHETLDAAEIYEMVNKLVVAWADASGRKPAAGGKSKTPPRGTTPQTPSARPKMVPLRQPASPASAAAAAVRRSVPRTAEEALDNPDHVRARAAAVFAAASSNAARKGVRGRA